ncbi:MAG: hypothetical protein AB1894_19320 [Chloroflexota bacterium]
MKDRKIRWGRLAILLGSGLGICILCWVLGIKLGPKTLQTFRARFWDHDPTLAAQRARALIDYDLPSGYQETRSLQFQEASIVIIDRIEQPSELFFEIQNETLKISDPENQQYRESIEEAWARDVGNRHYDTRRVGEQTATIRGQTVSLSVREGEDEDQRPVRQWIGVFAGKQGDVILIVAGTLEAWDQALVEAFLASIR